MVLPSLQVLVQMLYYLLRWRAGTQWQDEFTQFNSHTTEFGTVLFHTQTVHNSRNNAFQEHISAEVQQHSYTNKQGTLQRMSNHSIVLPYEKYLRKKKVT